MPRKIKIEPGFIALVCSLLYFGDLNLFVVYAAAATVHELGHLLSVHLFGHSICRLTLSIQGANILLRSQTSYGQDILLALSGPLANFFIVALCMTMKTCPLLAGVNLLLGLFNLLPVIPLDGSIALKSVLSLCIPPSKADRVCIYLSVFISLALTGFGAYLFLARGGAVYLVLLGLWFSFIGIKQLE